MATQDQFWDYYTAAIPRAFWSGWDWALAQGLLFTLLFAFAIFICAALFSVIRAIRKYNSWANAMKESQRALRDFFMAAVGATAVSLLLLFVVFFVNDAPVQSNAELAQIKRDSVKIDELTRTLYDTEHTISLDYKDEYSWRIPPEYRPKIYNSWVIQIGVSTSTPMKNPKVILLSAEKIDAPTWPIPIEVTEIVKPLFTVDCSTMHSAGITMTIFQPLNLP